MSTGTGHLDILVKNINKICRQVQQDHGHFTAIIN